jgi:UDP-N-acetylmuramate--alanine ligase
MSAQRDTGHAEPPSSANPLMVAGEVHFVGIAGAGMSALAAWLLRSGVRVSGCDVQPGETGDVLRALGARVEQGHDPAHIQDADVVVSTVAVPADHGELAAARARGIPVYKRAEALGLVVGGAPVLAVAGTHGKTTTSAMATAILAEAQLDPTAFVGGRVASWGGGFRAGSDELFVVEADEYDRSFLSLHPRALVVTSVEADHLDVYGSLEHIEQAFRVLVERIPAEGVTALCMDEPVARRLRSSARSPVITYGTGEDAALRATDIAAEGRGSRFQVREAGQTLGSLAVGVPGVHNVRNSLGAFAAARHFGADFASAQRALANFSGVGRRFEQLGSVRGIDVIDDYAHHPTEIRATLAAARTAYPGRRLVAVFQPHLYSRTRDFTNQFGEALAEADVVWVTDVYPAREAPIPGITGEVIADAARAAGARAVHYRASLEELIGTVARSLATGDVCLALGAGNIDVAARELMQRLQQEPPA